MKMKSVMKHVFSQIPDVNIPRSSFRRPSSHKSTFDAGYLIPVFLDSYLPGDTFNMRATCFARIATLLKPIMDNLKMDLHFFSVPNRLVWDNWVYFMGEKVNPDDSTEYTPPVFQVASGGSIAEATNQHYMGIPLVTSGVAGYEFSSLPSRALNLVYNEWYRDQNLIDSLVVDKDDGPDDINDYKTLQRRGKRHDYFTSALPWPQKGDSVELPLGSSATVKTSSTELYTGAHDAMIMNMSDGNAPADGYVLGTGDGGKIARTETNGTVAGYYVYPSNLYADLSDATASTVNALRQAFQLQKLLERDARGGTRYVEIIRSHFGVETPSAGWRTEYLGGGTFDVNINPVVQQSANSGSQYSGDTSAFGTISGQAGFVKSFTEHGLILGIVSTRIDGYAYQQGLDREFSRETKYDWYWPALSHIGEQAILNKEIYLQGTTDDELVFGYQERYAEYRYKRSLITGKYNSLATSSIDIWHLAQEFGSLPTLGQTFIEENPPMSRVVAVNTQPHFLFDSYFDLTCVRPMPIYSVPGMIDHF